MILVGDQSLNYWAEIFQADDERLSHIQSAGQPGSVGFARRKAE
jgi:hypothetical protein